MHYQNMCAYMYMVYVILLKSESNVVLITYSVLRLTWQDLYCAKQVAHILFWWATLLFASWRSQEAYLKTKQNKNQLRYLWLT